MVSKSKIESFIDKIPPAPKALKETILFLNIGELHKAAMAAQSDLALQAYLKGIVNKPIFGFKNKVSDISQIFGILGVSGSQTVVYNYLISLLSPNKWSLFKLNSQSFNSIQDSLVLKWKKILEHLEINDKEIESSITLLPAGIIITEALFHDVIDDVNLLRGTKDIDYNTILKRLCGTDLFDISKQISNKWEMSPRISEIVEAASGVKPSKDESTNTLGKWMHLLLFYELSQPNCIEAGLNNFIDFQVAYVTDIYEDFEKVMEIV